MRTNRTDRVGWLAMNAVAQRGALGCAALWAGVLAAAGCSARAWTLGFADVVQGPGTVRLVSSDGAASLPGDLSLAVYSYVDENILDVYLTDMPIERLANEADDLGDLSGQMVHVRVFVRPLPGRTPVDPAACNAGVRHAVFAFGAVGLYGGGGFVDPGEVGGAVFKATVWRAPVRLNRAGGGFVDALGPSVLSGRMSASLDERAAGAMAARFSRLAAELPVAVPRDEQTPLDAERGTQPQTIDVPENPQGPDAGPAPTPPRDRVPFGPTPTDPIGPR
ncbi:MAG: hypothetical protein C0475_04290 [Planctomyces sp.]|nr:hypothetical protein [Planctomyces sp.]